MKTDYTFALIELDAQEAQQFANDTAYHDIVVRHAERLSDEVQRTVEICGHDTVLETVTNY